MIQLKEDNLIIIDIETAPDHFNFEDMPEKWQQLWSEKTERTMPEGITPAEYFAQRAGVMAEFSRIVCISVGVFYTDDDKNKKMLLKSFFGFDEKKILHAFIKIVEHVQKNKPQFNFAGHNIKEFDIPFLCRRMIINGITLPKFLDFQNMKPWETNIVDTFQYWRFGDYKNYTSLKLLAACLGIDSPKDDIDGSMVGALYWSGDMDQRRKSLERIARYCQKDVITTGNIILRFKNQPIILDAQIEYSESALLE